MNRLKQVLGIVILMTSMSCVQNYKLSNSDKEIIRNEVTEMFFNYHLDVEKEGLLSEFNYLDQSTEFFWVPPGYNSTLSYDSVRTIIKSNAKTIQTIELTWDTLQVFPLSLKIANYSGIVKSTVLDTAGTTSSILIIESGTVIKRSDGWKLLNGQSAVLN